MRNGLFVRLALAASIIPLTVVLPQCGVGSPRHWESSDSTSSALKITSVNLPQGVQGKPYSGSLQATGGMWPYKWSVSSGTLPPGISLSSSTGKLSGTPTKTGKFQAMFEVNDRMDDDSAQAGQISVTSTSPSTSPSATSSKTLTITAVSLPKATLNDPFSVQLQASGGEAPYTWSIIGGAFPSGLSMSSGGQISGTPTATGTFTATVQVVDSTQPQAQTAMTNLTIVVIAALQVTTSSLTGGTVSQSYNAQLNAAGGSSPYTWTIASGELPSGLYLSNSGAISGTPDTAGTSSFTAVVKDSTGNTAQKGLSISISNETQGKATLYGVPWNGDGLSNTPIGRSYNRMASYRFRASHSGEINSVRLYLAFAKISSDCTYSGYYAGGTGGKILLQLQTDDGTSNHLPSGNVLASYTITDPLACNPGKSSCTNSQRLYTFDSPAPVTSGTLYHLVFSNTDANPSCNWTSNDNLYLTSNSPNMQPMVSDTDFAELIKDTGSWAISYSTTPIMDLVYSDGTHFGQGFMYKGHNFPIQGGNQVRETFTVSGSSVTFSKAYVRLQTVGSPGPATVTIQNSSGSTVASGTLSDSSLSAKGWGMVDFGSSSTLTAGEHYNFIVSAPADSSNYYTTWPLQAGTAYGISPPNDFSDGYFQDTTNGSTWQDYSSSRTDFDLQFYVAP